MNEKMKQSWEDFEPSPIEFMHGQLLNEFHKWRESVTKNTAVLIDGTFFNQIVVSAKVATYEKYKTLGLDKAVLKSVLKMD